MQLSILSPIMTITNRKHGVGAAVLRLAGAGRHHHPGGGAHGTLFPLELWGLSEPDDAAAVGWGAVFSHLLHLPKGAPRSIADRRRPDAAPPLRAGPLCGGAGRERAAGAYLPCAGGGVLLAVFWLVRLGRAAAARSPHPAACADLRAGQRLAAGQVAAVGALRLDAGSVCVYGSAAARGAGDLEWAVFLPVSADAAGAGPGLFGTAAGGALPVRTAGSRACAARAGGARKQEAARRRIEITKGGAA